MATDFQSVGERQEADYKSAATGELMQTLTPVRHRFALEMIHDGRTIHSVALERADFARATEAVFFDALRKGRFAEYAPPLDRVAIEPVFSDSSPHASEFDAVLPLPGGGEQRRRFDSEFFANHGRRVGAKLAVAGQVPKDATLLFRLAAYADEIVPRKKRGLSIGLEEETPSIPIRTISRRRHGLTEAWDRVGGEDFPVLIPRHVIDESVEEARRCPQREVGGVLLGHLCRDADDGELFLEVSCLVPGEETEATALSVTFTHATWARTREVASWRGEGELIVGWMHSHPFKLCAECPLPVPTECQAKVLFYSADDEFLMESSFARPFMVGLLAGIDPKLETTLKRPPVRLYGWEGGLIQARGFEVISS